jgi:hypothetical protein
MGWQEATRHVEQVDSREGRGRSGLEGRLMGSWQPFLLGSWRGQPLLLLIACSLFIPVQRAGKTYFPLESLFILLSHFPIQ